MVKNKKPNKKAQMKDTNINTAVRDALRPLEAFNNLLKALNEFIDIQAEIKAKEMLKKKPKKRAQARPQGQGLLCKAQAR